MAKTLLGNVHVDVNATTVLVDTYSLSHGQAKNTNHTPSPLVCVSKCWLRDITLPTPYTGRSALFS